MSSIATNSVERSYNDVAHLIFILAVSLFSRAFA
jgi:hypothetical protein